MPAPAASRENGKKGGRPPGTPDPHTKAKEQAREDVRRVITEHLLDNVVFPLIKKARGVQYLVTRDSTGKFIKVTEAMSRAWKRKGKQVEIIEVWEKEPCTQSGALLLAYAIDRPKEQPLEVQHDVNWDKLVARLNSIRDE